MRRFVLFVAALTPIMLNVGCEDGPAQTYSPAPNGAATVWNGPPQSGGIQGDGGIYVNPGTDDFDASFGGQTVNDTCTGPQKKALWHNLFQEPIQIPGLAGGIDIAGGYNKDGASGFDASKPFTYDPTKETWVGATVEQAEAVLCQGAADSIYTGVTTTIGWGENAPAYEFSAEYNANNRQITDLLFQFGYTGSISATSQDGTTTYSIGLTNLPIQVSVNGATPTPVTLPWTDVPTLQDTVRSIYAAFMFTYAPTYPMDTDCVAANHCEIGNNYTEGGYMFFTPLNIAFFVNNTLAPQPAASTMGLVDLGLLKLLPFSLASTTLKLDNMGLGPLVSLPMIGGTSADCEYTLGETFGMFDSTCVQVFGSDTAQNQIAEHKLLGGMAHNDEAFSFDVLGVDPNFVATLADDKVIGDTQTPGPNDVAYRLTVDQYTLGSISNDFVNNDPTGHEDLHGVGLVILEWANLVQKYMKANHGVTKDIGDATCIAAPQTAGCSGIEGIITTAPAAAAPQYPGNALGVNAAINITASYDGGLKPGTWYSVFCHQFGAADGTGYGSCDGGDQSGPTGGFGGYLFSQMQYEVQNHYGTLANTPADLASRRFYFQQWILALVKYLKSADDPNATLLTIDSNVVDPNNLFFDSAGGGFETGTYVETSTVNSKMQAPTALSVTTNLTTSVINDFDFERYNFRGEKALYTAMTSTPGDLPGSEPLYVSNIVGAPILATEYAAFAANPVAGTPDTRYECATNTDPNNPDCGYAAANPATGSPASYAIVAPTVTDALGTHPLYQGYQGAFGQSVLAIAANGSAPPPSPITINPTGFELIHSAQVTMPVFTNPFDPTTAQTGMITVLVPYQPEGANVGFPVTIDGSRDKFYNTYNVDLTGTTVNGNVDYEYINNTSSDGGVVSTLVIRAFETQSYLGLVFACDSGPIGGDPSQPDDILAVRMYDNSSVLLNWIGENPDAATACGLQIKYSIYGNYADYISFLNSGVRFGLNPGFGGSVISDVTLFDPNVVASLGQ